MVYSCIHGLGREFPKINLVLNTVSTLCSFNQKSKYFGTPTSRTTGPIVDDKGFRFWKKVKSFHLTTSLKLYTLNSKMKQ